MEGVRKRRRGHGSSKSSGGGRRRAAVEMGAGTYVLALSSGRALSAVSMWPVDRITKHKYPHGQLGSSVRRSSEANCSLAHPHRHK